MGELVELHWYNELVDDCKAIITESVFTSHWALIEGYHEVGKRLKSASDTNKISITDLVTKCAVDMNVSERKLWYAVKFFGKYPDITALPDGKAISWHKIKTKYLTDGKEEKVECDHIPMTICRKCKKEI
jgi:hypothetical protein